MKNDLRVLSLFDGMSCGQIALKKAGINISEYNAAEIDKYAIGITKKNFPKTNHIGDVFSAEFKPADLLIGGSPCTFWSISKRNRETTSCGLGFDLFSQYVRALDDAKPKYFLYENNFGIHQDIQDEITKALGVKPIMIDSALVSAQKRKRLYWTNIPYKPLEDKKIYAKDILENTEIGRVFGEFTFNGKEEIITPHNGLLRIGSIGKGGQGQRIYSIHGKTVNFTANGGGQGAKTGLYLTDYNDIKIVRKLIPLEAERGQTIPEGYTEGVSDTQRYKLIGNGWTCDVISNFLLGMS